ncbi:MAG: hypothetical protein RIA65_14220, partial [Woeseia sp.]
MKARQNNELRHACCEHRQSAKARRLLTGLAACIALQLGTLTDALAIEIEHPVAFVWAGYDNPAFYPPYVTKYGRPPDFSLYGDEEEALQKMRAGYQPDIMLPCANVVDRWNRAGLLGTVDTDLLSNWDDVIPALKNAEGGLVDGRRVMIPTDWGLTSVIYRTDIAPEYIDNESYSILWDPKYKG